MRRLLWLMAFLALAGCGRKDKPAAEPASDADAALYTAVAGALPQFLDHGGWVVSRGANTNEGDSLFFSGLAMYGLTCADGEPIAAALEAQMKTGVLVRYPGNKDSVSLDGQLGLYRGIAYRVMHCAETARWHDAMAAAKLDTLTLGYDAVRQDLLAKVGLADHGADGTLAARLEADSLGEARAANTGHIACFRLHFSLVALQTREDLGGKISELGRAAFCDAARGTRIATLEHFCGRDDLAAYVGAFKRDVWIYAHQRCPGWETPDAKGDREPGTDALVALQDKKLGL